MKISMISNIEKVRAPSRIEFRRGLVLGAALLLHEQMHDPSEKKRERRFDDGDEGAAPDFLAEAPLFLLAVMHLVGHVAHHHCDADCRNDAESRSSEGRDHEPSPQHAQRVAVEDGTGDHQERDTDDSAENAQCNHFSTSSRYWISATLSPWSPWNSRFSTLLKSIILRHKSQETASRRLLGSNSYWIKKFSSPKIKIWFAPMFFYGFFCGFERCGSAAFRIFRGRFSPPAAAKWVRTNSRIEHHLGNCKFEIPASLRSAVKTYWILGSKMNWRFCIRGEENFLILNF